MSLTKDGAAAITNENTGLIGLYKKCAVQGIGNLINARSLQHRLFRHPLDEMYALCGDLIWHAEVHWLN
jgi:hypothetical protein